MWTISHCGIGVFRFSCEAMPFDKITWNRLCAPVLPAVFVRIRFVPGERKQSEEKKKKRNSDENYGVSVRVREKEMMKWWNVFFISIRIWNYSFLLGFSYCSCLSFSYLPPPTPPFSIQSTTFQFFDSQFFDSVLRKQNSIVAKFLYGNIGCYAYHFLRLISKLSRLCSHCPYTSHIWTMPYHLWHFAIAIDAITNRFDVFDENDKGRLCAANTQLRGGERIVKFVVCECEVWSNNIP